MIFLAVRYSFLFWLSISDSLVLPNMEADDQDIYRISACTARCLWRQQQHLQQKQQQQQQQHRQSDQPHSKEQLLPHFEQQETPQNSTLLENCYYFCREQNTTSPHIKDIKNIPENLSLKLVCRDDRNLTFRIYVEGSGTTITTSERELGNGFEEESVSKTNATNNQKVYVIKIHLDKKAQETLIYMSDDNVFTISDLRHNTTYNITAVVVHANNQYSMIAKGQQYRTLRLGFTPGMVQDIQIKDFHVDDANKKRLNVEISWKPSVEMTCHYNIICFSPTYANFDLQPLEIRNPRQLYTYKLVNLSFSHVYRIGIRAKNPNNLAKESELFWKKVETPSCVEWYKYNFNICTPLEPQGLEVEHSVIGPNEFALNISWQQPEYLPDYYTLSVLDLAKEGKEYIVNVSKLHSSVFLPRITLFGSSYQVNLTVYTPGGNSCAYVINDAKMLVVVADKHHVVKLISAILAPLFCFGILILTTFIICHRRAKLKRYQERCKYFEELEKKAPIDPKATFDFPTKNLPNLLTTTPDNLTQFQLDLEEKIFFNDAMEIYRDDIMLYEVLGEGAFGLVRRGIYKDDKLGPREVAVKMLKDHPSADDVRAFRREIEVMKSVERHPNIVGIIGHCTKRCSEMLLLTEYCSLGNLLNFLRNEWKYMHELNFKLNSIKMSGEKMHLSSKPYQMQLQQQQQTRERQVNNKNNSSNNTTTTSNNNSSSNNNNINVFNLDATFIAKIRRKYKNLNTSNTNAIKDYYVKKQRQQDISKKTTTRTLDYDMQNAEILTTAVETITQAVATNNKSYGYDEICTNACKCQVDVLVSKDIDPQHAQIATNKQSKHMLLDNKVESKASASPPTIIITNSFLDNTPALAASSIRPTIQVKNCNCSVLVKNNQKNARMTQQALQNKGMSIENRGYYKYLQENVRAKKRAQFAAPTKNNSRKCTLEGPHENVADNDDHNHLIGSAKREPLSAADLLDISKQVAEGMEFLAKNKVVHRDLAARNVLVAPDRTIKIADFGLSRDVYQENIYKKTGNGKLPIKWLALESMTHQVYTTQSDVWSYGILLYEIATLGGTPYPSIPTNRLLHLLKSGYRMEKPKNCGQEFYNLMYSCWAFNPSDRPNFTEIIKILENLMNETPQSHIESMIMPKSKRKIEEVTSDDDSYLKPL